MNIAVVAGRPMNIAVVAVHCGGFWACGGRCALRWSLGIVVDEHCGGLVALCIVVVAVHCGGCCALRWALYIAQCGGLWAVRLCIAVVAVHCGRWALWSMNVAVVEGHCCGGHCVLRWSLRIAEKTVILVEQSV